jgi:hypothetical protein
VFRVIYQVLRSHSHVHLDYPLSIAAIVAWSPHGSFGVTSVRGKEILTAKGFRAGPTFHLSGGLLALQGGRVSLLLAHSHEIIQAYTTRYRPMYPSCRDHGGVRELGKRRGNTVVVNMFEY